ncbi:MAG: hypothetical protein H6707_15110 [Deltaproteobacteria bacterium]|nr:hypothetical protein [Deltaproteobacteria bacterium]
MGAGFKASHDMSSAVGEIGEVSRGLGPRNTRSLVVIDAAMRSEIEQMPTDEGFLVAEPSSSTATAETPRALPLLDAHVVADGLATTPTLTDDAPDDDNSPTVPLPGIAAAAAAAASGQAIAQLQTLPDLTDAIDAPLYDAQTATDGLRRAQTEPEPQSATMSAAAGPVIIPQPIEPVRYGTESPNTAVRLFGVVLLLGLIAGSIGLMFFLYRDGGLAGSPRPGGELKGLQVSPPIIKSVRMQDAQVLTAEGVVVNRTSQARRFIYIRGSLNRHATAVAVATAPAGNVFSTAELQQLSLSALRDRLNPAGRDGRNTSVAAGQSVAYQVILADLPEDYSPKRYKLVVTVEKAEVVE